MVARLLRGQLGGFVVGMYARALNRKWQRQERDYLRLLRAAPPRARPSAPCMSRRISTFARARYISTRTGLRANESTHTPSDASSHGWSRKPRTFALVGKSGTGKSFKARQVARRFRIDLIIDDGLLIRGQKIIAGRSAKREKGILSAIKTAVFANADQIEEVRRALASRATTAC